MQPKSDRSGRVKIRGPLYSDKITDSDVIIIDDEEGALECDTSKQCIWRLGQR
jgi:hypothetical protein